MEKREKEIIKVFSEKFLQEKNYTLLEKIPELELLIYRNKDFILAVNDRNTHGSVSLIKNTRNFDRIIDRIKKDFADCLKKQKCEQDSKRCPIQTQNEKFEKVLETKKENGNLNHQSPGFVIKS